MKIKGVFLAAILTAVLCISGTVLAACPSADLTGDCRVDMADLADLASRWLTEGTFTDLEALASQWLTEGLPEIDGMVWVSINDPGVSGHEPFNGEMSKYETTNAQYCQFLNAALASGDITVSGNNVIGAHGSNRGADFVGQLYFVTFAGDSYSQIIYSGGIFSVRSRDGFSMANHPVVMVSWYGSTAFCNYYGCRLPTEWEWQAVADYDGSYTYGCGTAIGKSVANFDDNGWQNPIGLTRYPWTSPVGLYPAYGYGMCDMAGNVWEWTSTVVYSSNRILRGGGWGSSGVECTVSALGWDYPWVMGMTMGFRVCR